MGDLSDLRTRLASVPHPVLDRRPEIERAIAHSVEYLGSDAAQRSLDADTYWPKWNSPWWHMLLLHELGEARRIPERAVSKMVEGLNALRVKIFPIHPEELPNGADPHRDVSCHCAIGSIHQVLSACGVDVDSAVPWIRPWFVRYQMADGGLNCDSDAYLQSRRVPELDGRHRPAVRSHAAAARLDARASAASSSARRASSSTAS